MEKKKRGRPKKVKEDVVVEVPIETEDLALELPISFEGKGEVKGFSFTQVYKTAKGYIYKVKCKDTNKEHYECFKRKVNTKFSKHEHGQISYPRSASFGIWAWTFDSFEKSKTKIENA